MVVGILIGFWIADFLLAVAFPAATEHHIPIYYHLLNRIKTKLSAIVYSIILIIYSVFPIKTIISLVIWAIIIPLKYLFKCFKGLPATKKNIKCEYKSKTYSGELSLFKE